MSTPTGEVRIALALISDLAEKAAEGYRRVPWGGVEIGGLLLGRRKDNAIEIIETRPVECEHEFGPAFHLSAKDMEHLEGQIAEHSSDLEVVGWYRTTSRDLGLTSEDADVIRRFFADPGRVTLVIQRGKELIPRFGLFARASEAKTAGLTVAVEFTAESASANPDSPAAPRPAPIEPKASESVNVTPPARPQKKTAEPTEDDEDSPSGRRFSFGALFRRRTSTT